MKTKYVCHGLISKHVNFHNNQLAGTVILLKKICRWGKEKEPLAAINYCNYLKMKINYCICKIVQIKLTFENSSTFQQFLMF